MFGGIIAVVIAAGKWATRRVFQCRGGGGFAGGMLECQGAYRSGKFRNVKQQDNLHPDGDTDIEERRSETAEKFSVVGRHYV